MVTPRPSATASTVAGYRKMLIPKRRCDGDEGEPRPLTRLRRRARLNVVVIAAPFAADPVQRRMPSGDEVLILRKVDGYACAMRLRLAIGLILATACSGAPVEEGLFLPTWDAEGDRSYRDRAGRPG